MNKQLKETRKLDLTFITLTYNQSEIISEHLDSLLFQVKNNLKSYSIQLIVSDDASTDKTIDIIKNWLKTHGDYFDSVSLLTAQENQGTCKNFTKAITKAKGKYIKALAGDDIYLTADISNAISLLSVNDIVITPSLYFYEDDSMNVNESKLEKSKFSIIRYLNLGYENIRNGLVSAPETPGVFFNRYIFTETVLNFISKYDLIEDRPLWISVLEENVDLKIGYNNNAYIGYRQHPASVSKGNISSVTVRYKNDQRSLSIYQIRNCSSYYFKFLHAHDLLFSQVDFKLKNLINLRVILFNLSYLRFSIIKKLNIFKL